jgi:hypothetical protein
MRLVHYTDKPISALCVLPQDGSNQRDWFKPRGLWVSDDDCADNWRAWCEGERFSPERLALAYDIALAGDANVLVLRSVDDIDAFTRRWAVHPVPGFEFNMFVDWSGVRAQYQGMIVTPYIWERRLSFGKDDAMWYYSWDCASGCIWDPAAIASMTLRPSFPGGPQDVPGFLREHGDDDAQLDRDTGSG